MKQKMRVIIFFVLQFLAINLLFFLISQKINASEQLKITFFDVGQGDSALIDLGNNFQILVDGGPDSTVLARLGDAMPYYDRKIEMIILTHPDFDHLLGLIDVVQRYDVEYVFATNVLCESESCQIWQNLLQEKHIKVIDTFYGRQIVFDEDTKIDFLYPFTDWAGKQISKYNDSSIVFKLVDGENKFLFAGDVELAGEMKMHNAGIDLQADLLKVAHHGSKTSSSILFLEKVNSKWAVISVGENKWGMPNEEAMANLFAVGTNILTTRESGDIIVLSDGEKIEIPAGVYPERIAKDLSPGMTDVLQERSFFATIFKFLSSNY